MCEVASSRCRNDASSGLSRSLVISLRHTSGAGSTQRHAGVSSSWSQRAFDAARSRAGGLALGAARPLSSARRLVQATRPSRSSRAWRGVKAKLRRWARGRESDDGNPPDEVAGVADRSTAGAFTERQRALLAVSDELLARRAPRTRLGAPFRRVSATARRSNRACSSGTTKAWRPRSTLSASNSNRAQEGGADLPRVDRATRSAACRRARATPPHTRASRLRRARRSARR